MLRLPLKNADLGPRNLFHIYAAASNGINPSAICVQRFQSWAGTVSSFRELCRRGKVARLLSLVLLPKVQVFDTLGTNANMSLISLSSRRHLLGG